MRAAAFLLTIILMASVAHGEVHNARREASLLTERGRAELNVAVFQGELEGISESISTLKVALKIDASNLDARCYLGRAYLERSLLALANQYELEDFNPATDIINAIHEFEALFGLVGDWPDPTSRKLITDLNNLLETTCQNNTQNASLQSLRHWWATWKERAGKAMKIVVVNKDNKLSLMAMGLTPPSQTVRLIRKYTQRAVEASTDATTDFSGKTAFSSNLARVLTKLLREDASPQVRRTAAEALVKVSPSNFALIGAGSLRTDSSPWVRMAVADAIAELNPASLMVAELRAVKSALLLALRTDTPRVAVSAAHALGQFAPSHEALFDALSSNSILLRRSVANILSDTSTPASQEKFITLLKSDTFSPPALRESLLACIGPALGDLTPPLFALIKKELHSDNPSLRSAGLWAIRGGLVNSNNNDDLTPIIHELLNDTDPTVSLVAAEILLINEGASIELLATLKKLSSIALLTTHTRGEPQSIGQRATKLLRIAEQ